MVTVLFYSKHNDAKNFDRRNSKGERSWSEEGREGGREGGLALCLLVRAARSVSRFRRSSRLMVIAVT